MRLGYDLEKTETRVCEIFGIEKGAIFSRSRVKVKADAGGGFASSNRPLHWLLATEQGATPAVTL